MPPGRSKWFSRELWGSRTENTEALLLLLRTRKRAREVRLLA